MPEREYPHYYYTLRDEILALMQAHATNDEPFDIRYRKQFVVVAKQSYIRPVDQRALFNILKALVSQALGK